MKQQSYILSGIKDKIAKYRKNNWFGRRMLLLVTFSMVCTAGSLTIFLLTKNQNDQLADMRKHISENDNCDLGADYHQLTENMELYRTEVQEQLDKQQEKLDAAQKEYDFLVLLEKKATGNVRDKYEKYFHLPQGKLAREQAGRVGQEGFLNSHFGGAVIDIDEGIYVQYSRPAELPVSESSLPTSLIVENPDIDMGFMNARAGMNFLEIQENAYAEEIQTGFMYTSTNEVYYIEYTDDAYLYQYVSNERDGSNSWLIISQNWKRKSDDLAEYYGSYEIVEFCPTQYYSSVKYDVMPEQEADMMLGKEIVITPEILITYDTERRLGTRGKGFGGNYIIEKYVINNPQIDWKTFTSDILDSSLVPNYDMKWAIEEKYYRQLEGIISVPDLTSPYGTQFFYTLKDRNILIMYSTLTHQYFILEKRNNNIENEKEKLSEKECGNILQKMYGEYEIVEFLPTKYYPAIDSAGYEILPKEEAEMMLGKKICISEELFSSYDNKRLPNSEITNRLEDGYWVEKIEIQNPQYQVEKKMYCEIYGIRDDILRDELQRQEYVAISVYPGYEACGDRTLPQLLQIDDSRVILYSMGEYFLLEK